MGKESGERSGTEAHAPRRSVNRLSDEGALVLSYLDGRDLARAVMAWPRFSLDGAVSMMLRHGGTHAAVASALPHLHPPPFTRSAGWLLGCMGQGYRQGPYLPPVYRVLTAVQGPFRDTLFHWAARHNRPDLIQVAARTGLSPDALMVRDAMGCTPGDIAAQAGHADVIVALLKAGVPPAAFMAPSDLHPFGSMGMAVRSNRVRVIEVLCEAGVDPNTQDPHGFNLAQMAAQENRPEVIEALGRLFGQRGIPLTALMAPNRDGHHAAALAAVCNCPEAIRALLRAGIQPGELMAPIPQEGATCLHMAARHGVVRVVSALADADVDLDTRDAGGWAAIHRAAENDHAGVIAALFESGRANVNATGPRGVTAAHLAVQRGHQGAMEALRAVGASFDMPDFDGRTARAMALMQGLSFQLPGPATPSGPQRADPYCRLL